MPSITAGRTRRSKVSAVRLAKVKFLMHHFGMQASWQSTHLFHRLLTSAWASLSLR